MKSDAELKRDVVAELEWEPSVNATQVGVAVKDGNVTVSGHLETYAEKDAIERAVRRVHGVRGLAVEIDVRLDPGHHRSDSEIVAAAETVFRWNALIPQDRIQVMVDKGWITLSGEVDWDYQRQNAEKAVRTLKGVVGVSNALTLKARPAASDIAGRIRAALIRHAVDEAGHIELITDGGHVILRGRVDSLAERSEAVAAAWAAPGVCTVTCELTVQP